MKSKSEKVLEFAHKPPKGKFPLAVCYTAIGNVWLFDRSGLLCFFPKQAMLINDIDNPFPENEIKRHQITRSYLVAVIDEGKSELIWSIRKEDRWQRRVWK